MLVFEGACRTATRRRPKVEYVELRSGACEDCAVAIAIADYSGMSVEQAAKTRAGIARINKHLVIGEELGFAHSRCAVCNGLPGHRHQVGYLEVA
jgi:hypothetical protein